MSQFDASTFLDFTTTEESVKRPPIPVGDYLGVIGELSADDWVSQKDPTKSGKKFIVPITLDLPEDIWTAAGLNNGQMIVTDTMMLDITPQGSLDYAPGKNGKLHKYREATNNNKAGQPFNPRMLQGQAVTVKIGHREYPEGSGDLFEQVAGIAAHQ